MNLGDLHRSGASPTLDDVLTAAPSTESPLSLNGFGIDGGSGSVTGSLTLYLLDDLTLSNSDFIFGDSQETWRADAGAAP